VNNLIVRQLEDERLFVDFAACLENVELLCAHVEQFLLKHNTSGSCFDIFLMLREVVNNAVIHGSKCDSDKRIKVTLTLKKGTLTMEVEDQGQGFDWQTALALDSPDPDACCGRGMYIARLYADSWAYAGGGNKVILTKTLQM